MAGYVRLTKNQEQRMVGRTYFMLKNGYTNAEIAEHLKRPITQVDEWIEMCKNAESDEAKKAELDKIWRDADVKKKRVP